MGIVPQQYRSQVYNVLLGIGSILISTAVALYGVQALPLFRMMENWVADFRIAAISAPEPQHADIVVVAITEETLQQFSYRAPIDRLFLANLLRTLESKEVRAILLDILLDQLTEPDKDANLKAQLSAMKIPIIVSYSDDQSQQILTKQQKSYQDDFVPENLRGLANLVKDPLDDTVRWIYPGKQLPNDIYLRGVIGELATKLGRTVSHEQIPIAWRGAPDLEKLPFRLFPAHTVSLLPGAWFKDKIVLIGTDLTFTDRHRTPFSLLFWEQAKKKDRSIPGILVHAHALAQLLDGRSVPGLSQNGKLAVVLLAALFGLLLAWLEINLYLSVLIELLVITGYWAGAILLFHHYGLLLPLIAPTLGAGLGFWLTMVHRGTEMRRQKRMAQAEARIKAELLANMSHEIRTPINAIIGMTELVLEEEFHVGKRKYLSTVISSAKSLLHLINDILDYSKMESGKMVMEQIVFDLRQTMTEILETLLVSAKTKGIKLELDMAPQLPNCFIGDPNRLRQVVVNLVGNAIKFTETGGVTVIVTPEAETAEMLRFAIVDTGIGIPANRLDAIFESYTQAEGSTARKHGGTGLGTTISKQIVDQFGGRIWVESEVGKGSTFFFVIRIPEAKGIANCRTEYANATLPDSATYRSFRVLLVDDVEANRNLAVIRLQQRGHQVTTAVDGLEAVALAAAENFDLILMDLHMPRMNGFEAAQAIRRAEHKAGTRGRVSIIALTAEDAQEEKARCLAAGMDDCASKPIDFKQLFFMIEQVVPEKVGVSITTVTAAILDPHPLPTQQELPPPFAGLSGIDVARGLLVWGNADMFRKSLVGFGRQHAGDGVLLREALDRGDIPAAKSITHTLKGTAGNLAATDLATAAAQLDNALSLRSGDAVSLESVRAALRQRNLTLDSMVAAVDEAMQVVAASCRQLEADKQDSLKDPPVATHCLAMEMEPEYIEWMQQFARDLDRGNADHAETCLEKLRACPLIDSKSLESLVRQVDDLELDEARKTLANIAKSLKINLEEGGRGLQD